MSYKNFQRSSPYVVFDSEWCRVSFSIDKGRPLERDRLIVRYGRLHAPNDQAVMEWNGEPCRCWHNYLDAVFFIDGITPDKKIQMQLDNIYPKVIQKYYDSELAGKYREEYRPKSQLYVQKTIWDHYGKVFFEVFDLRRPDLWEEYTQFIKDIHRIRGHKGPKIPGRPRRDEIC